MIYVADVAELDKVLADVEGSLESSDVPTKYTISFLVAVEEIFVNIANYAYCDKTGEVDIELVIENGCARITFTDAGIPFDPLAKDDPDVSASAEDRPIGGLGIYMVKKSMDGIQYERRDDKNILSFWKDF